MRYLCLSIAILLSCSVAGQVDLLGIRNGEYFYQDRLYKANELEEVYAVHLESLGMYLTGRNNIRAANFIAKLGIPIIFGGFGGMASGDYRATKIGRSAAFIGGIIELIGLIPRIVGNSRRNKAFNLFNNEMIDRQRNNTDTSLLFGVASNGVGLVFQF